MGGDLLLSGLCYDCSGKGQRHNSCSVGNTIRKSRQSIENIVRIGVVVGQCSVDFRPAEDFAQIEKGLLGRNVAGRFQASGNPGCGGVAGVMEGEAR